jgi:hypothetical protein
MMEEPIEERGHCRGISQELSSTGQFEVKSVGALAGAHDHFDRVLCMSNIDKTRYRRYARSEGYSQ